MLFVARHHTPGCASRPGRGGTIRKLIQAAGLLRPRHGSLPRPGLPLSLWRKRFSSIRNFTSTRSRGGPAFQPRLRLRCSSGGCCRRAGLMAREYRRVGRRKPLPDRGGAAHGVNAGNRQLATPSAGLRRHTAVQLRSSGQVVALGFRRRVEANTASRNALPSR